MSNIQVKEVNFNGDTLVAAQENDSQKIYVGVRWVCEGIGLTVDQAKRQVKNIRDDPLLNFGYKKLPFDKGYGEQITTFLEIKYLPIWLSKINTKSLNEFQYEKLINLLNWCLSSDFERYKIPTKDFQWEGELRDEIYDKGYFSQYKIIGRELTYSFGRIDLLAKDENDRFVVIELKKNKNYNDVIQQCNKYIDGFKNEFNEDIKVIICTLDEDKNFLKHAKSNGFEVYKYIRKLKLLKVS